jgi:hypothetical protein
MQAVEKQCRFLRFIRPKIVLKPVTDIHIKEEKSSFPGQVASPG